MRIYNEFGVRPTTNHKAAGYDFYIPNIVKPVEKCDVIFEAFSKSYKMSVQDLHDLQNNLLNYAQEIWGDKVKGNEMNILFLYLFTDAPFKLDDDPITYFVEEYLIFDDNNTPGICPEPLDQVFINSGIHVALNPHTVGIFFNKSGKGTKGWDVRAQVIDEDYTGFVHLSLAYTKDNEEDGIIYVGDKITQMIIWNIEGDNVEELDKETYYNIMAGSQRGASAFGSSDEKH